MKREDEVFRVTLDGKRLSGISGGAGFYAKSAIGCLGILAVDFLTRRIFTGVIPYVIATVALSIIAYVLIESALGNEAVTEMYLIHG